MRRIILAGAAAAALALPVGASAALDLKFHPVGGGSHSYASWKGQEGEADSRGDANQAFYLQHGETDDGAAGVVEGLEGVRVTFLTSFQYEHRKDGKCTATDPRWTLFVRGKSGKQYVVNLGCAASAPSPGSSPGWIRRTFTQPLIRLLVSRRGGADALNGTVSGLALAYDRTFGSIFLDNIAVASRLGGEVWTSAADNGQGVQASGLGDEQVALLAEPLTTDELLFEDDLFLTATADEWAAIQEDADPS